MELFVEALTDALIDSAKMVPLLFVIYFLIELVEYKFGNKMALAVSKAGAAGPAIGALAGSIPQCGVSVMGTALYTQRLVTIGTLIAIYLSTSDEAIPVILSQPDKAGLVIPLILAKIVIAIVVGYVLDLVMRRRNKAVFEHLTAVAQGIDEPDHHHEDVYNEKACCGHEPASEGKKLDMRELFFHPIVHTLKIFVFIFLVTLVINLVIGAVGTDTLAAFLGRFELLQPFAAALVGLIPNCAASVAITELYLEGAISFAAVIAGLCASGGLGILVLFKEDGDKREAVAIVGFLFIVSILAGFACGVFIH